MKTTFLIAAALASIGPATAQEAPAIGSLAQPGYLRQPVAPTAYCHPSNSAPPQPLVAGRDMRNQDASLGGLYPFNGTPITIPARPAMPATPLEAFRSGTQALRQGKTHQALAELEYAADQGVPGAIWKLGRMYADGDGVSVDKGRAYEYFRRLTTIYSDDSLGTPNAGYISNAFVMLGEYHLEGIPDRLEADPHRAREMFRYAASYFADPEAQYYLGRLYLFGKGGAHKDPIQAARWLNLAADKGDHRAQALLGEMLFKGDEISRQAALGLFWLIMAKDGASLDEGWITDMYTSALAQATENDRALAHKYLEN
jgi:TPR repeat protein